MYSMPGLFVLLRHYGGEINPANIIGLNDRDKQLPQTAKKKIFFRLRNLTDLMLLPTQC